MLTQLNLVVAGGFSECTGLEAVMTLKRVLSCGAKVTPDPKRAGFYEVESRSTVYYIYAPRLNGKVTLLPTWPRVSELAHSSAAA